MDFLNKKCKFCSIFFMNTEDIVVCPKCGASYHRKCYEKIGKCDHAYVETDYTEQKKSETKNQQEINSKTCPFCKQQNSKSALFCQKCGMEFSKFEKIFSNKKLDNMPISFPFNGSFIINNSEKNINYDSKIDNIKTEDICDYVQTNIPYYITIFNKIKNLNSNKFNFVAFLFSGGWLLYRKNYILGTIISAVIALITIFSSYLNYTYYPIIINELSDILGVSLNYNSIYSINHEQLINAFSQIGTYKIILFFVPTILLVVKWSIMFFIGFKGNKIYFKQVKSKITKFTNETSDENQFKRLLKDKGGVNTLLGIYLIICYFIINILLKFFIM